LLLSYENIKLRAWEFSILWALIVLYNNAPYTFLDKLNSL
jgi:hypothetical protein